MAAKTTEPSAALGTSSWIILGCSGSVTSVSLNRNSPGVTVRLPAPRSRDFTVRRTTEPAAL